MSQICFKKEGMTNYMVMPCEYGLEEGYQSCLLKYHAVPYFLQYEVRELDGEQSLYYRLKYRTTLRSVLGHLQLNRIRLENMAASIVGVMEMAEEYLLEQDGIIWRTDRIFLEADTGKLHFCYCPVKEEEKGSIKDLLTEIIQAADKRDEKSILFILQFYNIVTEADCSLDDLKRFMKNNVVEVEADVLQADDLRYQDESVNLQKQEERYKTNKEMDDNSAAEHSSIKVKRNNNKEFNDKDTMGERIVKILLIITAGINFILIASLIFNILTYDYTRYLLISMAVLIILTIVYMHLSKEESADEIMQAYFENSKEEFMKEKDCPNDIREEKRAESSKKKEELKVMDRALPGIESSSLIGGETSVLIGENQKEETDTRNSIVVENCDKQLFLESMEKGRFAPIYINKNSVVLGTMEDSCNYTLAARGVSRMHAKLMKKEDGLYLLDLNSTNGTYLNGEMVESGQEYKLEEGDMVAFALSEFYVSSESFGYQKAEY